MQKLHYIYYINKNAMKKILFISAILICFFSCKKEETKPAQPTSVNPDTTKYYPKGTYHIYVNSNYMFPYLTIEKTGTVIDKRNSANPGYATDTAEVHYVLNCNEETRYKAYTQCSKNISDSTKNMFDNNKIWNRLTITHNGDTIYNMSNDINYAGPRSAGNVFYFDVK